jgi:hypothetical protein
MSPATTPVSTPREPELLGQAVVRPHHEQHGAHRRDV